jgi:hypothetical protein
VRWYLEGLFDEISGDVFDKIYGFAGESEKI